MARHRKHGEDLSVAEWHRRALENFYKRIGHRLSMADRDWTEFCKFCHEPLCLWEEIRDRGQNLAEKSTSVTERLARIAGCPAWLVAARIPRSPETEAEIASLWRRLMDIYAASPPDLFSIRRLWPRKSPFAIYSPAEFAEQILILHREHHRTCAAAKRQRDLPRVKEPQLEAAKAASLLWTPYQEAIELTPPVMEPLGRQREG